MAAPTDVYGSYSTMCYLVLAIGVGWASTRLFWPATAAILFRERAAAQLEICIEALRDGMAAADPEARRDRTAQALSAYTKQTAMVAKLHGQAQHERVERGLDDRRRADWVALVQDLFDPVLAARPRPARPTDQGPTAWVALHEAMDRAEEALVRSIQATADALRGSAEGVASLAEARDLVEARIDELRGVVADGWTLDAEERATLLVRIDAIRCLSARQLAIEAWVADWRQAMDAEAPA
jgi:hypothetical protein